MSVFLERQKVRKRRAWARSFKVAERVLLSLAIVLGGLALLYGAYLLVFLGPTFLVRDVIVEGSLTHTGTDGIIEKSGIKKGENLFAVDVEKVHRNLKEDSWISRAAVRRKLPHSIWIYVEEYSPQAVIQRDGKLKYIDYEGNVFKSVEPSDPKTFPVIGGVDDRMLPEAQAILSAYSGSPFGRTWGISELNFDEVKGYTIFTEKGPIEILLGHDAYASRLDLLGRWQGTIGRRGGRITYILANEDKRLVVGYRGTTSDQQT